MSSAIKIWNFPGGIHPPERKSIANQTKIKQLSLPEVLYIPLKQHIGAEGELLVSVGDSVLRGQPLTQPGIYGGLPIHAPTSGTIVGIEEHPSNHPSAIPTKTIQLKVDGEHKSVEFQPLHQIDEVNSQALIDKIRQAGISGLGGAGYPTAQKLSQGNQAELLIINGVECEPYIVSDDRLMREYAAEIISGAEILQLALGNKRTILAIEDNKPEAITAIEQAIENTSIAIDLAVVPTKYPSGGEKQLIQLLTGKQVPSNGYPADIGIIMQNVGTAFAVHQAVKEGVPLMERVVTITGEALEAPGTAWVLLGTPIEHLLRESQFKPHKKQRVVVGGPMMGYTITELSIPVVKTTNCILCPTEKEIPVNGSEMACIRCGHCEQVCPASLLPQQLYWYAKAKDHDALKQHHLKDCIECGACAYVCPSEIPLVHYYRKAKADIREELIEQQKADIARQRFEARQARLEREKQARLERHEKAAQARKEALAKREAEPSKTPESSGKDSQSANVAAAIARAKAKKKAQQGNDAAPNEDDKKAKVAAAVARAKAKKEAQQGNDAAPNEDDKKAKIAAAVARAKAKKEAQTSSESTSNPESDSSHSEDSKSS